MISINILTIGCKVHYQPEHYGRNKWKNGIVKELRYPSGVWVVYNCAEKWDKFGDYTAAKTQLRDLKLGWKEKDGDCNCVLCEMRRAINRSVALDINESW